MSDFAPQSPQVIRLLHLDAGRSPEYPLMSKPIQAKVPSVLSVPFDEAILTEDGVAQEFARRHGERLRYCHGAKSWLVWNGSIWQQTKTPLAFHYARELAREMRQSVGSKASMAATRTTFAAGVERFAQADPVFARTNEHWDTHPWFAGSPGGTIDLHTGMVLPADPALGITKSLAVSPTDTAECPLWLRFMSETFGGDAGVIRFIQQYAGYSLTGDISEHALIFGYGYGRNGKSVLLNTLSGILGDYAVTAAMDTFTASKGDKHPTDLAMLRGARFVTASETEEGKPWAESRIKQLTGGDAVTARFMRADFFTFRPEFKLCVVGNHRPVLRNVDAALRRRFNIVSFSFIPEHPDLELEAKLRSEWPGILRWMIEGELDRQRHGLIRPNAVTDQTEAYFQDQDLFGQWLEDDCDAEAGNPHKYEASGALYARWTTYAETAGEKAGNQKAFAEAMDKRGFERHRGSQGTRQFRGLQLRPVATYGG